MSSVYGSLASRPIADVPQLFLCIRLVAFVCSSAIRLGWSCGSLRAFSDAMIVFLWNCVLRLCSPASKRRASQRVLRVCPVIFLSARYWILSRFFNWVSDRHGCHA